MTTQTTEPVQQAAAASPPWRSALQLATNATWQVSGAASAAPYCVSQQALSGRDPGIYTGHLHYLSLASLREIAAEYGATVAETPAAVGGTTYTTTVIVQGVTVTAWAVGADDADLVVGDPA